MLQTKISHYATAKDNTGTTSTLQEIFDTIASDQLANQIYTIANEADKKKRNLLKSKLPGVTFSGTFSKRNATSLTAYSGLICIDFDGLAPLQPTQLKKQLPPFALAAFTSPSANGLKVICRVEGGPELHLENFQALEKYFFEKWNLTADTSGKDISRLCFLSWDLGIVVNPEATTFTRPKTNAPIVSSKKAPEPTGPDFEKIRQFTDNKKSYQPGQRNDYINTFVMNCKTRGIAQEETAYYCTNEFTDYEDGTEAIKKIVNSVYANPSIVFGKHANTRANAQTQKPATGHAPANATPHHHQESEYVETIKFWYETTKTDKTTGEVITEHKFDHDGLTFFLANNGFRKLRLGEKGFQFVRLKGNLIESVEPDEIQHFIMQYLHKNVVDNGTEIYHVEDIRDELHEVRKMYKRGVNSYTKIAIYTSLPELRPTFLRDTETTAYLYFENGYVEITAEGNRLINYENLTANIWSKQRKQHAISLLPNEEIERGSAFRFLQLAIAGHPDKVGEKEAKRFQSMLTTIGYIIDTYKDPTNTKAPVFQDRKINVSGTEANGGSGKTLTAHLIAKVLNTCMIDGKTFSFDAAYPYDTFQADHKLIVYNDVNKRFSFDHLFHKITEDFSFDKRYVNAVVIPHEDAPKHLVITNYSLTGDGGSFRRRQQIVEFTDYFNDEHTPKDEFKHRFFIDWDVEEWNRFYNLMIYCVHLYKRLGLIPFPAENVKANKLLSEAGEEFIDWMDELFIGDPEKKIEPVKFLNNNKKDELFQNFKEEVKRWSKLENTNKFTNWVKLWADMRGFTVQTNKSGRNYSWTFVSKK